MFHSISHAFNPLPNDKFLDCSKLKAFADDKINVTEKLKFVLGTVENSIFSFSHTVFNTFIPHGHQKSGLHGKKLMDFRIMLRKILLFSITGT